MIASDVDEVGVVGGADAVGEAVAGGAGDPEDTGLAVTVGDEDGATDAAASTVNVVVP